MGQHLAALDQTTVEFVDLGALQHDGKKLSSMARKQPGWPQAHPLRGEGVCQN